MRVCNRANETRNVAKRTCAGRASALVGLAQSSADGCPSVSEFEALAQSDAFVGSFDQFGELGFGPALGGA